LWLLTVIRRKPEILRLERGTETKRRKNKGVKVMVGGHFQSLIA